jgi:Cu/Ag efflux protein CusF
MNKTIITTFLAISLSFLPFNLLAITDNDIETIKDRLETYSKDELIDRRDYLMNLQADEGVEDDTSNGSNSLVDLEITMIEALLALLGIVMIDNVTEDTPTPPDTVSPVVTVTGDNPATVELGATYSDAGATSDGGETVVSSGTVDTSTVGSYTITYTATDAAGNVGTATRTVNVVDTTAPVITITGDNPATVELGETYSDAGATATDLDTVLVSVSGTVDVGVVGSYTITYTATDASGNTATAIRTVNVVDTTAPVVTVTGDNPVTVELGGTYVDAGATATDFSQTQTLETTGSVDTDTVGTYTITYTATDASGNEGTATRTVNVVDTTGPVITITGDNPATVELGGTYVDAGATATDASGIAQSVTSGTVDTSTLGTYTLTYTFTDASGNVATATRTVNVVDTTAPVITVNPNRTNNPCSHRKQPKKD